MAFSNYRKETSEKSDSTNWAKQQLIAGTSYHFEGIEGCNENAQNVVTHLMERARVDFDGNDNASIDDVYNAIVNLETISVLTRKINFADAFGLPLTYILYCDEVQKVWRFEFMSFNNLRFIESYDSYQQFSNWIYTIKGWRSTKTYREDGLPYFDIALRRAGTAWPTNLDCFICDSNNLPVAILEFQNAKTVSVRAHCNNEFFLCKQSYTNQYGYIAYHDDIRRWVSQEIIRLQSGLRLFVVTWQQNVPDYILKEVEKVTFPLLPGPADWTMTNKYKAAMNRYANTRKVDDARAIANNFCAYSLIYSNNQMTSVTHNPPLSFRNKTFPFIYYKYKELLTNEQHPIPEAFEHLMTHPNGEPFEQR